MAGGEFAVRGRRWRKWLSVNSGGNLAAGIEKKDQETDPNGARELVAMMGTAYDASDSATCQQTREKAMGVDITIGSENLTERTYQSMYLVLGPDGIALFDPPIPIPGNAKIRVSFKNMATAGNIYGEMSFGVR